MATGLALAGQAAAGISPGKYSLSPFLGGYTFEGDQHLRTRPVYGLRIGYDFCKYGGAEAFFHYVATEPTRGDGSVNLYACGAESLFHFTPDGKFVPHAAAGFRGTTLTHLPGDRSDTEAAFDYGVGGKYFVSETVALRADIRHIIMFNGKNNLEYVVGLGWYFGGAAAPAAARPQEPPDSDRDGVPDDADRCPGTPQGVKVDRHGCPVDSDGDGVPDYLDKCPDTPRGIKVDENGCPPDSDGDGVPDYLDKCPETPRGEKVDRNGCPEKKPIISLNIIFDSGSADIRPGYDADVAKLADVMKKYPNAKVTVEGHTDSTGNPEKNMDLSRRRAGAVRDMLVEKYGIESSRVSVEGFGATRPVADNATPEGRQANRRIDIVFTGL